MNGKLVFFLLLLLLLFIVTLYGTVQPNTFSVILLLHPLVCFVSILYEVSRGAAADGSGQGGVAG